MRFLYLLLLVCIGGYLYTNQPWRTPAPIAVAAKPGPVKTSAPAALARPGTVLMYSLTTCGRCKMMAQAMNAAGIRYVEYFVDSEPERNAELAQRLVQYGYRGGPIGMPVIFAGRQVFLGQRPIQEITAAMQ